MGKLIAVIAACAVLGGCAGKGKVTVTPPEVVTDYGTFIPKSYTLEK